MALSIQVSFLYPATIPNKNPRTPDIAQDVIIKINDAKNFSLITSITGILNINEFPKSP